MSPSDFFNRFCAVVVTPGGFRYPVILAPEGCPFLKDKLCGIHSFKPIGCSVFPESSLLPVTILKRSVRAIESCAILALPDSGQPLKTDHELMAMRDLQFEHTKAYFEEHDDFDELSWVTAKDKLKNLIADSAELARRSQAVREKADKAIESLKQGT